MPSPLPGCPATSPPGPAAQGSTAPVFASRRTIPREVFEYMTAAPLGPGVGWLTMPHPAGEFVTV